jgi:hypothetical protein
MWAQHALSTAGMEKKLKMHKCIIIDANCAGVKCKNVQSSECMCCICGCSVVPYIVLAVMCIYVIYKCLSWDGDQQQDLGKPS